MKMLKLLPPLASVIFIAIAVGVGGYLLAIRNKQPVPPAQPSPLPQMTPAQTTAMIVQPSNARQSTKSLPTPTQFNTSTGWRVYKSEFGYQYSYPSTWLHYPEINAPSSGVSAPGATYHDGHFTVERKSARECDGYRKFLSRLNPSMKQNQIAISEYQAFQLEGKSRLNDGHDYDRKTVLIVREDTCYYLDITSRNNPEQLIILNQILSTFMLSD